MFRAHSQLEKAVKALIVCLRLHVYIDPLMPDAHALVTPGCSLIFGLAGLDLERVC